MTHRFTQSCLLFIAMSGYTAVMAETMDTVPVGKFSAMSITDITPVGWRPLVFNSIETKTAYFLTRMNNQTVVQAVSHGGASAFYKNIEIASQEYPVIQWQWQIKNVLQKADIHRKSGDDYPARIYLSFEYDPQRLTGMESIKYKLYSLVNDRPPPLAVINYVWDKLSPSDTLLDNAYSKRVKMIVVRSGETDVGRWVVEKRNIVADYRRAFGEAPGKITGIAIMTDTDNTGESATAWYGDITLHRN